MKSVINGIDIFLEDPARVLRGRNVALITGSSNINSSGNPVYRLVQEAAGNWLKALWSLQHGFFVDKQDNMILSDSFFWEEAGIEVKSLYGERLLPRDEWLDGIDALLVDVFDVGTRVYTFVEHLIRIMKYLSGKNISIIVLDRPNPLNGITMEGNLAEKEYFSIVGELPVPMRHGLTTGEFLSYALTYYDIQLELEIIGVQNWRREDFFAGTWTYPSPNMPSFQTALVYPGAVLLEGTNLSEGRGTTRPFEFVGAPFIDNHQLAARLKSLELPGFQFIPVFFKPEFSKFCQEVCKGILVDVNDRDRARSFAAYYEIIRLVRQTYPEEFAWKQPPYEFEYERLPIDMICGSATIREAIEKNIPFPMLQQVIDPAIERFREAAEPFYLY